MAAEPIGKNAAFYTAKAYMLAKGKAINQAQKPFKANADGTVSTEGQQDAYYYVFNAGNDGGYVIVSGDDRIDPILGYVDHGTFDPDNIPENMKAYLDSFSEEIKYVIDNDLQPTSPQLKRRSKVQGAKHSVPELLTCRWNQNLPYNLTLDYYWKEDSTQARPATGCIATAWAQVVYFHKWPDEIKVTIPSYSKTYKLSNGMEKTVTYSAIPKGTKIDWDNMQDTYSCSESHAHTVADTAVANLMYYVGKAVKMSYGGSSSASYHTSEFIQYFGYDDCANRISRDDYDIDGWVDVIYNELAEGYPIPVAGTKVTGAHAFVVDGFDGDELFHVNWGWGGTGNGWFLLGVLNRWNRGNGAIIKLRRPGTNTPKDEDHLSIKDVVVTNTSIKATFENKTGSSGSFHVGVLKLEDDGSYSLVGVRQTITGLAADETSTKSFTIRNRLPEGVHRLSPASKTAKGTDWKPVYNMKDQYIEAIVDSTGLSMHLVNPVKDISIDTIVFTGPRIVKQEQKINVTFRNNGDEYYHDVFLFASKTEEKVYQTYMYRVAAHKGETVTCPFYFTPETTGTYNLWFCEEKNGNGEIGRGTIEVVEEANAEKANLAVSYTIINGITDGKNSVAYGKRLIGQATINNNATKDFHGSIELQLWHQGRSSSSAVSGPSRSYSLDIPAGTDVTVDYEFDNLSTDYYYRFKAVYGNQSGNLSGGGVFDFRCDMQDGILTWKNDGTVTGKAYSLTQTTATTTAGFFADCSKKISRVSPYKNNTNIIYAFASGMEVPSSLDGYNVVVGNHSERIDLVNDKAFYIPVSFTADTASFTYTFSETEAGTGWHAFTMPFKVDSIFVDDIFVTLDDTLKHFWIYEFSAEGNNGEVIFEPATILRANTPYIIAGDATMAGHSVVFRSLNVPFYKEGTDKKLVTTSDFKFHGNTYSPKLKDCYILNADGTAFEYTSTQKTLGAMSSYFMTPLASEDRPISIELPPVPVNNTPDGINQTPAFHNGTNVIFNLAGQRLNKMQKGVNIINGRKVLK